MATKEDACAGAEATPPKADGAAMSGRGCVRGTLMGAGGGDMCMDAIGVR